MSEPTSIDIETFDTEKIECKKIIEIVREHFDLTPSGMIKELDLLRPIYKDTATYGHFGREDKDFPWEQLNKVDALKAIL